MSTIKPPVSLASLDNEHRVDYVQNVASQPDYQITPVNIVQFYCYVYTVTVSFLTQHVNERLTMKLYVIVSKFNSCFVSSLCLSLITGLHVDY